MASWKTRRIFKFRESLKRKTELPRVVLKPKKKFIEIWQLSRLWKTIKKILILIFAAGIIAAAIFAVFFSNIFKISEIIYISKNEIPYINIDFSSIFSEAIGRNFLFLSKHKFKAQVLNAYQEEIKSIEITIKIPSKLVVKYEAFAPTANLIVRKDNLERKFILNEKGIMLAEDAEDESLPYIADSFKEFPKKQAEIPVIKSNILAKIAQAHKIFTEKIGMKVNKIIYLKTSREIHLKTEKNFIVMLDLTQDIDPQLFKLKRALTKLDIYNTPLEYIDLRISGKNGDKMIFKRR